MIYLGQPSDLLSPTLHKYVYVVAMHLKADPTMLHFLSYEVQASDEDDAYTKGCNDPRWEIPMESVVLNDYVHRIGG
jgi:hypothetical protein